MISINLPHRFETMYSGNGANNPDVLCDSMSQMHGRAIAMLDALVELIEANRHEQMSAESLQNMVICITNEVRDADCVLDAYQAHIQPEH